MNSKGSISSRRLRAQAEHLDWLYPIPDPMDTQDQWERFWHLDLRDKTRPELLLERARLRNRLMYNPHPDPWLVDRLIWVEEALRHAR